MILICDTYIHATITIDRAGQPMKATAATTRHQQPPQPEPQQQSLTSQQPPAPPRPAPSAAEMEQLRRELDEIERYART